LVYALLFTAFGLFVLTIFSRRYEQRQLEIEQKFHGIQKIQQGSSSAGEGQNRLPTPADRPLIITLRPLMITLGALMVGAWAMLMWRRSLRPGKPHQGGHM
jgi:hypothetical protein